MGRKLISDFLDQNCFCQMIVNTVSAVLDGNGAGLFSLSDNGDRFTAVTAEREEECIELLVVGIDLFNYIFLAFDSIFEIHIFHRLLNEFGN